jgi:hypothetical protein
MASAEFRAGLEELQELARKTNDRLDVRGRTVVALPPPPGVRRPHRHGWTVIHIGPDGRATAHELTPFATPTPTPGA